MASLPPSCNWSAGRSALLRSSLALLLVLTPDAFAGDWEMVFAEDGLRVARRDYPGSPLQEIRGITTVEASLGEVMALLRDAPFNAQWVYRSGGASILREEGYARAWVYGVVDAPWPMQDRDTVVRFDYRQQADNSITITITNMPDFVPHKEQFVRVPDFGGLWRLDPLADGRVQVTYQVYGDPGGWVPTWLANYAAVTSVTRTLQAMPTALQRYRGARSESVREPPRVGAVPGRGTVHKTPE